ncbi:MAG: hypothetical protein J6F30_04050 [Cellulosilyticum sp.]|nr:hypothetical protein [Cellulosilyticum sp.]
MALQTLRTITNTATVTYQYTPSAGGPPISRTIEDTAINLLVIPPKPSRTFATSFTHNNSICFDVSECRCINQITHNARILSYEPISNANSISLKLNVLDALTIDYFSCKNNKCNQIETSCSVTPILELPDFIQPSQIIKIIASTINTQITHHTPCQLNVTSTIQYVILYDPNTTL